MENSPHAHPRRIPAVIIAVLVVAAAAVAGWFAWQHHRTHPLSEDAMLEAEIVHISAAVPGKMIDLAVQEGDRVQKGQPLFRIDPEPYEWRVRQAEAEVAAARAALSSQQRRIQAETENSSIAAEQIGRAQANLELAQSTLRRLEPLAAKGYVTQQQLDAARTAVRDAQVSLTQAQSQSRAAQELISETGAAEAAVGIAEASLALARRALQDTDIRAPHDGLVVGLNLADGEYLAPGESVFTLVTTAQWYATAFFRETDLQAIRAGSCATVYALADPSRAISGTVQSIGWGVGSQDMLSLPRSLPFVQKSLNWVRVAQRFPVRIALHNPPAELMRAGASASVLVRPLAECRNPS